MRPQENPLDLNNLPEDYGKVASEDSSSSVYRKKKSGAKEGKDEKVYECRFCSLKFCKSQALGGHMNRHRQERETETLNKARQLVFTNDLAPTGHLAYVSNGGQPIPHGSMGETPLLRPMYSTRLFPPPPLPPQPQSPYFYPSPPRMLSFHSSQSYPGAAPVSDYFVGQNYTCIGAPVGQGGGGGGGGGGVRDMTLQNQDEGLSWGRR